jgi:hypothetical protein
LPEEFIVFSNVLKAARKQQSPVAPEKRAKSFYTRQNRPLGLFIYRARKSADNVRRCTMKKITGLCAAAVLAFGLFACASTGNSGGSSAGSASGNSAGNSPSRPAAAAERKISGRVPEFVRDAVKNAPEDALVGIGTARLASMSQSRVTAATRGRAEISRQLETIIRDMVRDYQASSEVDPDSALAFQENITLALSHSTQQGSSVVDEDMDDNGNYWCVVMLTKGETAKEINQATAQAKLRVPAAASFDAERRMNEAFDLIAGEEIQVVDR